MALTRAKLEELIAAGEIEVGGGGVNANILYNWDFRNPVNQRGALTASGGGYWLDRWTLNGTTGATYTYNSSWGLRAITTTATISMRQYIESPNAYAGKTVTVSVDIYSASVTADCTMRLWYNGTNQAVVLAIANGDAGIKSFTATIPNTELTDLSVVFYNYAGNDVRIKSIKLELGTVSTLHLDPPMDWAVELPKCQRYYLSGIRAAAGYSASGTLARLSVPLASPMRITPTVTYTSGTVMTATTASGITNLSVNQFSNASQYGLLLQAETTGLTAWQVLSASFVGLVLSADL